MLRNLTTVGLVTSLVIAGVSIWGCTGPGAPPAPQAQPKHVNDPDDGNEKPRAVAPKPQEPPKVADRPKSIELGSEVVFTGKANEPSILAVDDDAWDRLGKAAAANDDDGLTELILQRKVFVVPGGTRAKVIQIGFVSYRLRILDGNHAGKAGWIEHEAVMLASERKREAPAVDPAPPAAVVDREPTPKPIDPAKAGTSKLAQGRFLEDRNPKAALEYYREVIKEYPDSTAAKTAEKRIKVMEAAKKQPD